MHRRIIETLLIFILFALFAGQLPPDVNESHYLTKAKHAWDPAWCSSDLFLASSFSHGLFYAAFAWLNQFFSLPVIAWIGRITTWLLLATGWQRLCERTRLPTGLSIVAAALFLLLNDRFHLAGEWVVGGFEAKGIAYYFVLLALGNLVHGERRWIWALLGLASAFHVLVGGWATLAVLFSLARPNFKTRSFQRQAPLAIAGKYCKQAWLPITFGVMFTLIGALPPLLADWTVAPEIKSQASKIYVLDRLAHHLSFGAFEAQRVGGFVMMLLALFLLRHGLKTSNSSARQRWGAIFDFAASSLVIALAGLLLSGCSENQDSLGEFSIQLLRFYWFRLADVAIPIAISLGSMILLADNWHISDTASRYRRAALSLALIALSVAMGTAAYQRHVDPRPRADRTALPDYPDNPTRTQQTYQNWRHVCRWIEANTPVDAVFITPDQQQTFKWYAERSEVVNWKDLPQDAQSMLQWRWRASLFIAPQRIYRAGLLAYSDDQLLDYAKQFGATHLLMPQLQTDLVETSDRLKQIYPVDPKVKATYVVFELMFDSE